MKHKTLLVRVDSPVARKMCAMLTCTCTFATEFIANDQCEDDFLALSPSVITVNCSNETNTVHYMYLKPLSVAWKEWKCK